MSARRFLWRWNLRVLRQEWRQHLVILVLLTAGVMLSVGGALAAYNLVEPPESEYGGGQFAVTSNDPGAVERALAEQAIPFGSVEAALLRVDGTPDRIEVRVVDPTNATTAPLLTLLEGRWPTAAGEVAVTDRAIIDAHVGTTFGIDGRAVEAVALVENPTDLGDEFVLAPDLGPFASAATAATTTFLVDADPDSVNFSGVASLGIETSGPPVRTVAAVAVNVVGALGLFEIALLVGAAYAVIAKRRARQFGLLAAAGASPKLIRQAAATSGTIVGLIGAIVGVVVGVLLAAAIVPAMESSVGHRIAFAVPWWAVLPNAVVAVLVARRAARWPARALSTMPVAHLLDSLRPQPEPVSRAAMVGIALTAGGTAALVAGFTRLDTTLALLGALVAPAGLLLMAPLLVQLAGGFAGRLSLAPRLAGRAVARHNRRSAAVVAALALALAVPFGIAVVTTSLDQRDTNTGPNLAENWLIAWVPGADAASPVIPAAIDADGLAARVDAASLVAPSLDFFPLEAAVAVGTEPGPWEFDGLGTVPAQPPLVAARRGGGECAFCNLDTFGFGERDENGNEIDYIVEKAWIASPELLDALDIDATSLAGGATGIARGVEYGIAGLSGLLAEPGSVPVVSWPQNASIPPVLVAPALVASGAYDIVPIGWMAASDQPISSDVRREVLGALGSDLRVEFHRPPEPQSALRSIGLAAGLLAGLGIAVAAVGLISSELALDLGVLASIGGRPRTVRSISASVAGFLAATGAVIAVAIGYLAIVPMLTSKEAHFPFVVPWPAVASVLILFPLLAAGVGWMAGRAPAEHRALREST